MSVWNTVQCSGEEDAVFSILQKSKLRHRVGNRFKVKLQSQDSTPGHGSQGCHLAP